MCECAVGLDCKAANCHRAIGLTSPLPQVKGEESRRASDKGDRASKRQRTSDIEVCGPLMLTDTQPLRHCIMKLSCCALL